MNVALYARVSSDAQDVELSIGAQLKSLREHAENNGYTIVREFVDEAQSGRTDNRPAFRELIDFCRSASRPVQKVLVWKFNRFARDRVSSVNYKHLLKKAGVQVVSINEPVDGSPSGKMLEAVIEAYDEFYSANLGEDIKRGMRQAASLGFFVASVAPFGYRKKPFETANKPRWTLEPDETESEIVKWIFKLADSGLGLKSIASLLNGKRLTTRRGRRWTNSAIHKLLVNPVYTGTLVWGGESRISGEQNPVPVRVHKAFPSLVSKSRFERVQRSMRSRRPSRLHPKQISSNFMLSGLTTCGGCGSALTGHVAKSGSYRYYSCSGRNKRGVNSCGQPLVRQEVIEQVVLSRVRDVLLSPENVKKLVRSVNRELRRDRKSTAEQVAQLDLQITEIQAKLNRYYEAFESGTLDAGELADRIGQLKQQASELEVARVNVKTGTGSRLVSEVDIVKYVDQIRETMLAGDPQARKTVLRSFIEKITIHGGNVAVEYHLPSPGDQKQEEVLPIVPSGGAEGIRTPSS